MWNLIIPAVSSLLDKAIPDKDEREKLAHEIATLAEKQSHEIALAQIDVNKVEAANGGWFRAGWRPFTAWSCAFAMSYHFIIQPVAMFVMASVGYESPVPLPEFELDTLMTVLLGMLGLGSMRSYERIKGKIPRGR